MSKPQALVAFDDWADMLLSVGSELSPAEFQGYLVGRVCVTGERFQDAWLQEGEQFLGGERAFTETEHNQVSAYVEELVKCLRDPQVSFQLLLPDDDSELVSRVECLGDWCHSFLTAYKLPEKRPALPVAQDEKEILDDIYAIANIEFDDNGPVEEEDERDFVEVSEFVRLAVINLYMGKQLGSPNIKQQLENSSQPIVAPASLFEPGSIH